HVVNQKYAAIVAARSKPGNATAPTGSPYKPVRKLLTPADQKKYDKEFAKAKTVSEKHAVNDKYAAIAEAKYEPIRSKLSPEDQKKYDAEFAAAGTAEDKRAVYDKYAQIANPSAASPAIKTLEDFKDLDDTAKLKYCRSHENASGGGVPAESAAAAGDACLAA